ncbi:Gut esterase 1 [Toxocara canis]|uniref:Carboxylic ester hydrolase n=1 Tax=Toxocara canis TaxID=6265 RepID=A0A0B2UXV6_TOXCA|nr:Gut esterase 1 [Toxocara canis]
MQFPQLLCVEVFLFAFSCGQPTASIRYGDLEGFTYEMKNGAKAKVFLGIPYASPPTADLRFEPPNPVLSWKGTRDAKQFGASCFPHHKDALSKQLQYSEVCLYLNIMAPLQKSLKDAGYPVIVFIHGGGFVFGSATPYGYRHLCDTFVSKGIVFVSINYRVGFLGFWTTGDHALPGNAGLWDQTQALEFISENIAAFGGDPTRITILGHSAGAASVGALSLSPHSNYLFQQAISLSGSIFCEFAISETTVEDGLELAKAVGCMDQKSKVTRDCMKKKSVVELLNGVDKIGPARLTKNGVKFHPRFDDNFLPNSVEKLMSRAPHITTMIGHADAESATLLFFEKKYLMDMAVPSAKISNFSSKDLIEYIKRVAASEKDFGSSASDFQQQLIEFFVERGAPEKPDPSFYLGRLVEMMSDLQFNIPIYHEIELKRAHNWTTYFFVQDYHHEGLDSQRPFKGACHCNESPYVFGVFEDGQHFEFNNDDFTYQCTLIDSIVQFVKTGNPSHGNLNWESVNEEHPSRYLSLRPKSYMVEKYKPENVHFWTKIVPKKISEHVLTGKRFEKSVSHVHTEL